MGRRRLNLPAVALPAILAGLALASLAGAAEISERMSLEQAIEAVRDEGINVAYSSSFVKPWMRVRSAPRAAEPLAQLRDALAVYGLALRQESGGWLVVEGAAPPVIRSVRADTTPLEPAADARATRPRLDEITIVASQHAVFSRDTASGQFLSGDDIRLMPHIADDSFRVFHKLPGVAANDFQAPFNLRGGATNEVKVVLDGLELFEPYHMRTLFSPLSIIDPGIIGQAKVFSGGFTAEHGNQMSGVVDFSSTWPSGEPVHQLGVSFVSSFARSSGAFADGRASYQVALRRGYLDLIADAAVDDKDEKLEPRYGDLFAKLNYQLNDAVDLSAQLLSASDDVTFFDAKDGEDFGGESRLNYLWLRATSAPSDGLTWVNTLFAGRVETEEAGGLDVPPLERVRRRFERDIDIAGVQSDVSWQNTERTVWKAGFRFRDLAADYDYFIDSLRQTDIANNGDPYTLLRDIETSRSGGEFGAYGAFRFQANPRLSAEFGLRWDEQSYTDTRDDSQVSPRVNAVYQAAEHTEIRLGWGYFHQPQGIQELQVQDGVTHFHPAQRAEHRVLGLTHRRPSGLEIQLDIYQKIFTDVSPRFENVFDTYEFAPESHFDRVRIDPDSARASGVELTVRRPRSTGLDWWLNYTWSEVEDRFDGIAIPRSWDQRHAVTAGLTWRGQKWNLSAIGRYHSGWPQTPLLLLPVFDNGGNFIGADSDFSQRNVGNYDDYSRVDVRLSRLIALPQSDFEFYLEIFNVLNSNNQCCIADHDLRIGPSVSVSPNVDDYLPFFPSFGFVWTFGAGAR